MFQNKQANKTGVSSKRPLKISSYFGYEMKTAVAIQNYLGNFPHLPPAKKKSNLFVTKAENHFFDS